MAGSTISGTVTTTVTLGSAAYPSPLCIANTGDVAVTVAGAIGVYAPAAAGTLTNSGTIIGGTATSGGVGGVGLDLLSGDTATNAGTIIGGGGGQHNGGGKYGGVGADLAAGAVLTNQGTIFGGIGGYLAVGVTPGLSANAGVYVTGGTLTNAGEIVGGYHGSGYGSSSNAGNGVVLMAGVLTNTGTITGGTNPRDTEQIPRVEDNGVYLAAGATTRYLGRGPQARRVAA